MKMHATPRIHRFIGALRARLRWDRWDAALFGILLAAGMFVFATCPPVWRDHDGVIQISHRVGHMTLIHYPPVYPLFSRLHLYATQRVQDWRHGTRTPMDFRKTFPINDAGVYALLFSQHLAMALASMFFCRSCASTRLGQFTVAALLISNASLFLIPQLVSAEALSQVLLIAAVGITIRVFRGGLLSPWGAVVYALGVTLAILTRHTNSMLAMLLPLACLLRVGVDTLRSRAFPARAWRDPLLALVAGVGAMVVANLTLRTACAIFDEPYRSIRARATSERLGFVDRLPPAERAAFLAQLQSQTTDPVIRDAIPRLARTASWVQQRDVIKELLQQHVPGLDKRTLTLRSDAALDTVADLFFRSFHPQLVQETAQSIRRALFGTSAATVAAHYLKVGIWSIDLYAEEAYLKTRTEHLVTCSPAMKDQLRAFAQKPWLRWWAWSSHGAVLAVAALAALVALVRGTPDPARPLVTLSIAGTALVAVCITFVLVDYNPRFTAATDLLSFLALGVMAGFAVDRWRAPTPSPAGPPDPGR